MNKKGQITIFIIIGILIVISIIIFFSLRNDSTENSSEFDNVGISKVPKFVQECLELTSLEGIVFINKQGGYYNIPENVSISYLGSSTSYYLKDNNIYIPTLNTIENELSSYIIKNIGNCLDYSDLRKEGFKIGEGNIEVISKINNQNIFVELNYPLNVEKGELSNLFSEFKFITILNILKLYETAEEVLDISKENSGRICLNCLEDLSNKNNVLINMVAGDSLVNDKEIIWVVISEKGQELNPTSPKLRFVIEK